MRSTLQNLPSLGCWFSLALAVAAALSLRHPAPEPSVSSDPSNPYRWADAAETTPDPAATRRLLAEALARGPHLPQIHLRVGNSHILHGEPAPAIHHAAQVLRAVPDYDAVIFSSLDRFLPNPEPLLAAIGDDCRASRAYAQYLIGTNQLDQAARVWKHVTHCNVPGDSLVRTYLEALLHARRFSTATEVWAAYLGPKRAGDYPTLNLTFNGGFEADNPENSPLNWRIEPNDDFETTRDTATARSGRHSLRITFKGTGNVSYDHVRQVVPLPAGQYRLTAWAKTKDITTNEGPRLAVDGLNSDSLTGTRDWTRLELAFQLPEPKAIVVHIVRTPSQKFDNKIDGTVWLDDFVIHKNKVSP